MAYDHSTIIVVPAASKDHANRLLCAYDIDSWPVDLFAVPLSADGLAPATHYTNHMYETPEHAATILGLPLGTLPTPVNTFVSVGLNDTTAMAAAQSLFVSVMTSGSTPIEHLNVVLSALELVRITS